MSIDPHDAAKNIEDAHDLAPDQAPAKPNCYACRWRRSVPGDAHSSCVHPDSGLSDADGVMEALGKLVCGATAAGAIKLGIRAAEHGVRSGWFCWPANFDPTWLLRCGGFEAKGEDHV